MAVEKNKVRKIALNMPQMTFFGLSENWFLKEIGDFHWELLCDAFNCNSDALTDTRGNRLYSSFVRVRYMSLLPLQTFDENEKITLQGTIRRYGNKMFFSDLSFTANHKKVDASLMTVFVARETDNKNLKRSVPTGENNCGAETLSQMPAFAAEYFKLKDAVLGSVAKPATRLRLGDDAFELETRGIFSTGYEINPYTDLNGVNLLYFAAYPLISDVCERRYFNMLKAESNIKGEWAFEASPMARDILYFGNCDIDDRITYHLDTLEFMDDFKVKIVSSLVREKDDTLISKIFTIKKLISP